MDTVTRVIRWGARLKDKLTGALGQLKGAGSSPIAELAKAVARKASTALYEKGKSWTQTIVSKVKGAAGALVDKLSGAVGVGRAGARRAALKLGATYAAYHSDPSGLPSMDMGIRSIGQGANILGHLKNRRRAYGIRYLIFNERIYSANRGWGAGSPYTRRAPGDWRHRQHVHATFDQGGYLKPGVTVARNLTGRREKVLDPAQTRAWEAAQVGGVTIHGGVHGHTAAEVAAEIEKRRRRLETLQPTMI
jgi:hypothetical protein